MVPAATAGSALENGRLFLLVNGKAFHLRAAPDGADLNERNWGLGVQYEFGSQAEDWIPFLTAAGFDDSNRNASYYAGGGWLRRFEWLSGGRWHADAGGRAFSHDARRVPRWPSLLRGAAGLFPRQ